MLIYTPFFSSIPWKGLEDSQKFTLSNGKPCRVRNCILSYNKEDFKSSDVVIFHGYKSDLPDETTLRELHNRRPSNQTWGFFALESPLNSIETSQMNGLFNWTLTYRTDSDVYVPYGFFTQLESEGENASIQDHSFWKDKLVVWTVSNCRGKRFSYVEKLKQFLKVDIFGGCSGQSCHHHDENCIKLLKTYKFQLAFENTECLDYVTEKYWLSPLDNGIVPIVMGGADYGKTAIPGSYIDVRDFSSVKELADYLLYLDKNNTAYNEYLSWRTQYKRNDCLQMGDMTCLGHWTCDLCALANNASTPYKVYENLEDFWSVKQCNRFSEQFDKIIG